MHIEDRRTTLAYALARRIFKGMKYIALSYCWGNPNKRRCIHLNGQVVSVKLNLWLALSGILRHHHTGEIQYYWIDALCINQTDEEEKSVQVRRMWKIYASAFETFAWVTHEDVYLDPSWTDTIYDGGSQRWCIKRGAEDGAHRASEQEYFSRTWIQSEILQAGKATFLYGRYRYDSYDLYKTFVICKIMKDGRADGISVLNNRFRAEVGREDSSSLEELLRHYMFTQCSDRRDVIFAIHADPRAGLLGGLRAAKELQPDYTIDISLLALRVLSYMDRAHPAISQATGQRHRSLLSTEYEHETMNLLDGLHLPRSAPHSGVYFDEPQNQGDSIIDNFCWSLLSLLRDKTCLQTTALEFRSGHRITAHGPRLEEVLQVLRKVSSDGWTPKDPVDVVYSSPERRPEFVVISGRERKLP